MNFDIGPIQIPTFKEKVTHSFTISLILGQILTKITQFFSNFPKFELILVQLLENFEKLTHSYTIFCIEYGVIDIPRETDFATRYVGGTSPKDLLYWVPPPPPVSNKQKTIFLCVLKCIYKLRKDQTRVARRPGSPMACLLRIHVMWAQKLRIRS